MNEQERIITWLVHNLTAARLQYEDRLLMLEAAKESGDAAAIARARGRLACSERVLNNWSYCKRASDILISTPVAEKQQPQVK